MTTTDPHDEHWLEDRTYGPALGWEYVCACGHTTTSHSPTMAHHRWLAHLDEQIPAAAAQPQLAAAGPGGAVEPTSSPLPAPAPSTMNERER